MLMKSKSAKYNAMDHMQTMMSWANDNLEQEDILEIIKGPEGKVVGLDKLQIEVMDLEDKLRVKRKELFKKTMALYFMKEGNTNRQEGNMIEVSDWMNSMARRDNKGNLN